MSPTATTRTRRLNQAALWLSVTVLLGMAGASGLLFAGSPMDLVLIHLVVYGAWAALLGGWAGGLLGAAVEEDSCGDLDMGVTSSMGSFLGAVAASLVAEAAVGFALYDAWIEVWIGAVVASALAAGIAVFGVRIRRRPGFDARGRRVDEAGVPLPGERQPLRMRDRLTLCVTAAVLGMLGLTSFMVVQMGSGFGSPLMLAPMAYGMSGGMLGGILGGWLAGLRDEHAGPSAHENSIMVAAMALMSGMMGAMPGAMTGAMMAVMGRACIFATLAVGTLLGVGSALALLPGRYRIALGRRGLPAWRVTSHEDGLRIFDIEVIGVTCPACAARLRAALGAVQGVQGVHVDVAGSRVALACGADFPGIGEVARVLDETGYPLAEG